MGERERRETLAALLSDLLPSEKEEKIYEVLCLISIRYLLALRNMAARAQLPFTGESNRRVSLYFRQLQLSKNGDRLHFWFVIWLLIDSIFKEYLLFYFIDV
jgi:hypothetical protein